MSHIPVLKDEVLSGLEGTPWSKGWFLDGTFGRGGHSLSILERFPESRVLGVDQDLAAVESTRSGPTAELWHRYQFEGRFRIQHGNFADVSEAAYSGALLDLGVSSPQLDEAPRGFSFYHDGPLDMRMNQSQTLTAETIVNTWPAEELSTLFKNFGEVRRPERAAQQIVEARRQRSFRTTLELSQFFERLDGWKRKGHHPATNYFQAIRIAVNHELDVLTEALPKVVHRLVPKGRLLLITFHSLEDRICKYSLRKFADEGLGHLVNKKVIQPKWDEKKKNPRSRSAKLRIFQSEEQGGEKL
jgi:16S rRNA (cytosine1402-N4)-methyltransferase